MNKDTLPQPENKAYEGRKMESGWAPSTTTMLGLAVATESTEETTTSTRRPSTCERHISSSVDPLLPKALETMSATRNEPQLCHPVPGPSKLPPQLSRNVAHSSLDDLRTHSGYRGYDISSSANANFQHSAPPFQRELTPSASNSSIVQPPNTTNWHSGGAYSSWLDIQGTDDEQTTDDGLFGLKSLFEPESFFEPPALGGADLSWCEDLSADELECLMPITSDEGAPRTGPFNFSGESLGCVTFGIGDPPTESRVQFPDDGPNKSRDRFLGFSPTRPQASFPPLPRFADGSFRRSMAIETFSESLFSGYGTVSPEKRAARSRRVELDEAFSQLTLKK